MVSCNEDVTTYHEGALVYSARLLYAPEIWSAWPKPPCSVKASVGICIL